MKKIYIFLSLTWSVFHQMPCYSQVTLYGMTEKGGTREFGTLFKVTSTGALTTLVKFDSNNGAGPYSSVIEASNGNLYGATVFGGINDSCVAFCYSPSKQKLTTLFDFDTAHLDNPYGPLIQVTDTELYGMTKGYLPNPWGSIYKFSFSGKLTDLYNFNDSDGGWPYGGLLKASDGNLYGMTEQGGDSAYGTLFRFTLSGKLTTLVSFVPSTGGLTYGGLIEDSGHNLYGMNNCCGVNGFGTIFKYSIIKGTYTVLHSFKGTDGAYPYGNVTLGADGYLYGMTSYGGDSSNGVIFKCSTSGSYQVIASFKGSNGSTPYGSLTLASDGSFYGMTNSGGAHKMGTIFKLNAQGAIVTLVSFNDANGAYPYYGSLTELKKPLGIDELKTATEINVYPNPFHNSTTVSVNSEGQHYWDVYDITGRELLSGQFSGKKYELSSQGLAQGMYFLRVFDGANTLIGTGKIVVQQ